MKRFKFLLISLILLHLCAFGVSAEENATITGDGLRIRGAPGTGSDILGTVNRGTRVEALSRTFFFETINGITARWYTVRHQDTTGYVFGGYLHLDLDATVPIITTEELAGMEIPEQPFRVVWEAAGDGFEWCFEDLRFIYGVLYCIGCGEGGSPEHVMLIDAASGEKLCTLQSIIRWHRLSSFPPFEGSVYYHDVSTGALIAFDYRSGKRVWSFDTGPLMDNNYTPAFGDGRVFVANADGRCRALDADTGRVVWDRTLGDSCDGPYLLDGELYVSANSDYGCTLYAVNPSTGETLWENDSCPYEFISTRYTQSDGMLYFFDYYTLTALDVQTGDEVWRYELDNEVEHAPEVYKDTIFVWDYEYPDDNFSRITLHALDRRSGVKKWTFRGFSEGLGCLRSERPITVEDGTIYLMASVSAPVEGEFYANYALTTLDAETGRTLWIYDEGPGSLFDVVVLGDEVYFGFRPDEEYGEHFLMILDAATGETVMRMEMRDLGNITTDGERIYTLSSESLLTGERADEVLTSLEFFDH